MYTDLHIHTIHSDGTDSVQDIFRKCKNNKISLLSITDHDNINAQQKAIELSQSEYSDIRYITGVELSSDYKDRSVHVLAYNFDHKNKILLNSLQKIREERLVRNLKIIKKLQHHGVEICAKDIPGLEQGEQIGRIHIAIALLEKKIITHINDAFRKYIGNNAPCYVKRWKLSFAEISSLIKKAGGVTVIAHPCLLGIKKREMRIFFNYCKNQGFSAVETFYSESDKNKTIQIGSLAAEAGLASTCGSDYHGSYKKHIELGYGLRNNLMIQKESINNFLSLL